MSARGVVKGLAGAVALLLVYPLAAYADNVKAEGDAIVGETDVVLTSCALPSAMVVGQVAIKRTGNEHYTPGESLAVRYSSSTSQIKVTGPATVDVPEEYTENGKVSEFTFTISTQVDSGAAQGAGTVSITVAGASYTAKSDSYKVTWNCGGVADTVGPTITVPEDITVEAVSAAGAPVTFDVTAVDNVTANPTVQCFVGTEPVVSGAMFPLGTTRVDCTATDEAGNSSAASFNVTVQDTTAPTLTVPGDITVEAVSAAGAPVTFDVTAVDAVTENPAVECSAQSGDVFALGATVVTCTAIDEAGNRSAPESFTVTVMVGWGGFLQPLNPGGPASFKLNSTIPVKFRLAGASAGITNLDARLYVKRVGGGAEFAATSTSGATTGNAFRWDADGRLYIFNLNTKAIGTAGTYELRVDLGDGVPHTIQVEIRK